MQAVRARATACAWSGSHLDMNLAAVRRAGPARDLEKAGRNQPQAITPPGRTDAGA